MMNIRNIVALGTAMAFAVVSQCVSAQDDLDNLLKDLENEANGKPAAKVEAEETSAAPAAEEQPAEKAEEASAAEAKPAEKAEEAAPAAEEKAEEPAKEEPAEAAAEKPAVPAATLEKAEAVVDAQAAEVKEKPAVAAKPAADDPDAELIANMMATEKLRRESLDNQARRFIEEARDCMANAEYAESVRHYRNALKLLNDRPASKKLRRECEQGMAEGLYRGALQEDELGRRDRAIKQMEMALDMRHPKARRVLDKWRESEGDDDVVAESGTPKHRMNEEDYKTSRAQIRKHLRRSQQYLALRDLEKALEECEYVLAVDAYNQDAIRLRKAIERKRQTILGQERKAAREGMIADVDEAWRPVYAVNASELNAAAAETVKAQTGEDAERTQEQDIERRMKEMRLPTISFKPPATIIEAVEFFREASRDYDRPDIPIEKRGFNFVLRTPQGAIRTQAAAPEAESNDFSSSGSEEDSSAPTNGLEPIQTITASDITFYEALKLVCDSVGYKFIVRGPVVMVMPQDMSTAELLSRKYNIPEAFMERVNTATDEMKELGGFGSKSSKKNDDEDESKDKDWKAFFEEMGVKWPEGSSIKHIKALGKLYVRNTRENLAEFEKVLDELGGQPQLIEIETRFVEVSQEDLNSLGFEWILNSDYSLNVGNTLGKALGINNGTWGTKSSQTTMTTVDNLQRDANGNWVPDTLNSSYATRSISTSSTTLSGGRGNPWRQIDGDTRNIGINAFGGTSDYGNGSRYLSTTGNHISGESKNTNDQFMRVNAFLGEADLSLILHMLSQRSDTDLLSAPKVVTKSGEAAVIKVVTEYIYPTDYDVQLQSSSSSGSSGGGGSSSAILAVVEPQNFTTKEVGVSLEVTPTYSEANGGTIDLELKPQVVEEPIWHNYGMRIPFTGNPGGGFGSLDPFTIFDSVKSRLEQSILKAFDSNSESIGNAYVEAAIQSMNPSTITYYDAPMEQPFFSVRMIESKVSITPGATVVMGGLITEQRKAMDDKVPFLGDLPYIGRLFRSHAEQTKKRNLIIFVTGRLITPSGRELRMNVEKADEAEVKPVDKD